MVYESNCPNETFEFAKKMASQAKTKQIYCLNGELGVGKTVFAKGFACGLGICEEILSPTFTIVNEHISGRLPLYHFDAYRLDSVDDTYNIGFDEYLFGDGVCLIEWSNKILKILPNTRVDILIEKDSAKSLDYRRITIEDRD